MKPRPDPASILAFLVLCGAVLAFVWFVPQAGWVGGVP